MAKVRGVLGLSEGEREIGYVNYCVSFVFALAANATLSFAVVKKSTSLLQSYKKVFVFHIIIDSGLSLMLFLTMCQPVGSKIEGKTVYFHIIDGIIHDLPQPWTTILASILVFINNYNITTACVSFVYRYSIICHNYELTLFPFLILVGVSGLLPGLSGYLTLTHELSSGHLEEKALALFNGTDWIDDQGNPPSFGIMYTEKISLIGLITPTIVLISYSIVIYCGIRITVKIMEFRAIQHFKLRYRQQRQLHILLFFQGIIPFFTSGLSPCAIHIGRIFNLPQPWWYFYVNLLISWAPVINPIVALIVIAPYRRFVSQFFCPKVTIAPTLPYLNSAKQQKKFDVFCTDCVD